MTTIYVKLIQETATGHEEVFRTTKSDYLPKGWELVKDLERFTIGGPLPYAQQEEPKKRSFWRNLLRSLFSVVPISVDVTGLNPFIDSTNRLM